MLRTLLSVVSLLVFVIAQPAAAGAAQATSAPVKTAASMAMVNLNTATAKELDALPGIGAKTAALIVDYRLKNGPFKKIEELMNVRGVGEKAFLKLKPQLTVATPKAERPKE